MTSIWWRHFRAEHDETGLDAEANILRYVPLGHVEVRHAGNTDRELSLLRTVAGITGVGLGESTTTDETDAEFALRLAARASTIDRVRLLTGLDDAARRVLHAADIVIDDSEPVSEPLVELPHWAREQAVSRTLHRHGRLDRV
jgi:RHH-type proline utilization regulon transcriptional repressor/proline dehydrogenase/delta 1-pyrroline-5-carboxylate dehydrogenase